jgi:3-oxoacid CoA-transferase subunit B
MTTHDGLTKGWTRDQMAARAAKGTAGRLLRQPRHRHPDAGGEPYSRWHDVTLQSENGMLGIGPFPMTTRSIPT